MAPTRRQFGKLAAAGVLTSFWRPAPGQTAQSFKKASASIKLGVSAPYDPSDDDLLFLNQAGIEYVYAAAPSLVSREELLSVKRRYADAGIILHNVRWFSGAPSGGSTHLANILLNLEGRDHSIELAKQWLFNYGAAGFDYTIATLSITGVWSSNWFSSRIAPDGPALTRKGITRDFDEFSPYVRGGRHTPGSSGTDTLLYGREYSEEEILENFRHFCQEIAPVAEESGVRIGFHPDDPPTYKSFGGVARINGTFEQIKRNIEIAASPNIGFCFCAGVWLEGGHKMGKDIIDAIRYFLSTGKVWEFNFRNVSNTVPQFAETFMDNGYYDMYPIMKVLVGSEFDGIVHQDHRVEMVGGDRVYDAYANAYMKALAQAARYELAQPEGKGA